MATKPPKPPHLSLAVICEKVMTEKDGVTSLIRLVDRVRVHPDQLIAMSEEIRKHDGLAHIGTSFMIGFKSGGIKGEHEVSLGVTTPSGKKYDFAKIKMTLLGDDHGINLHGPLAAFIAEPGLHWYDILLNGKPLTRMSLSVEHLPKEMPQDGSLEEAKPLQKKPRK